LIVLLILLLTYSYNSSTPSHAATNNETFFIDPDSKLRNQFHKPSDFKRPTNTLLTSLGAPMKIGLDALPLPKEVEDEFTEWIDNGLIVRSKDQMSCGGCWAFATTDSLTDKFIIATAGKWMPPFGLSAQQLISCGENMQMKFTQGCSGGVPQFAFNTLQNNGIYMDRFNPGPNSAYSYYQTGKDIASSCNMQAIGATGALITCPCDKVKQKLKGLPINTFNMKFNIDPNSEYKTADGAHIYTSHGEGDVQMDSVDLWPTITQDIITKNVLRMKKAIYYEGTVTVGISVTNDFYQFKPTNNNYFKYDGSSPRTGGHAVCIVGWKKIGNVPVWICRNSWGENWGYGFTNPQENDPVTGKKEQKYKGGFWNHIMGINDAFIESNSSGCHPDLTSGDIPKFLSTKVEKNWYENTTLRNIYNENKKDGAQGSIIQSIDNIIIELPFDAMSAFRIEDIFSDKNVRAILLTTDNKTSQQILTWIDSLTVINYQSMLDLVKRLIENIKVNIVMALKGRLGVIYYLNGVPSKWNLLDLDTYIEHSTRPYVASDRVFHEIVNFKTDTKITDMKILILTNSKMADTIKVGSFNYNCKCETDKQHCKCDVIREGFAGMVHPFSSSPIGLNERMQLASRAFPNFHQPSRNPLAYNLSERYRVLSYPYVDPWCGKMYPQIRKISYHTYT